MNEAETTKAPSPGTTYDLPERRPGIDLWLDGNEGSRPDPRLLQELATEDDGDLLRRYPDARGLERQLAARLGVRPEQVLVTAGADEALDRICRTFLGGRDVVLPEPTFGMLRHYAGLQRARIHSVPWLGSDFPIDAVLERVDERTGLVFMVSPNNPTGATATRDDLKRLAVGAQDAWLVFDGAYAEFATEDLTEVALAMPRALTVRTLSKAWGLAGCRVGYVVGQVEAIDRLRAAAGPYPVAGLSLAVAARRLRDDVGPFVERVRREVAELRALLAELGVATQPSSANFVLARTSRRDALFEGLARLGIAVRRFRQGLGLTDAVRITCPGSEADFARLTAALRSVLAPSASNQNLNPEEQL